ncbi:hypothetical protein PR003_g3340 [Phytophthora rubi]|uniref:MULE transposase domain-containing protein n=1 Tax=Phytophthora rubi TaxID=129364 RepID=A0A6A3NUS1_9STRA|nr:hypothetical protein PR001_g3437 [Phytophthora rubi]KAE9354447.1 hypothetical protein PR003_g3340 [Phytophthora rubi]
MIVFFRAFIALGFVVNILRDCFSMNSLDGTQSKNNKYRGVILTLIGRDGNGNNITVAFAVVHSENMQCFLALCCRW